MLTIKEKDHYVKPHLHTQLKNTPFSDNKFSSTTSLSFYDCTNYFSANSQMQFYVKYVKYSRISVVEFY